MYITRSSAISKSSSITSSTILFTLCYPSLTIRSFSASAKAPSLEAERVIFSGIQPTGVPHLGNYLGALRQWVELQNQASPGAKLLFSIVDLHALTNPKDKHQLRAWKKQTLATLLAVGLNPEKCTIFFQSDVRNYLKLKTD